MMFHVGLYHPLRLILKHLSHTRLVQWSKKPNWLIPNTHRPPVVRRSAPVLDSFCTAFGLFELLPGTLDHHGVGHVQLDLHASRLSFSRTEVPPWLIGAHYGQPIMAHQHGINDQNHYLLMIPIMNQ